MVFDMKTTLNIDDAVVKRLRAEAARRGVTMSALIEAGLSIVLDGGTSSSSKPLPPLPGFYSGGTSVDLSDRNALQDGFDLRI